MTNYRYYGIIFCILVTTIVLVNQNAHGSSMLEIKMNKHVYDKRDHPIITISGPANTILDLRIMGPTNTQKMLQTIFTDENGTSIFGFDLQGYENGSYSATISGDSKVDVSFVVGLPSPMKQFKSGILVKDIQCRDGLHLLTKSGNSHPICVKSENVQKIIKRGWKVPT